MGTKHARRSMRRICKSSRRSRSPIGGRATAPPSSRLPEALTGLVSRTAAKKARLSFEIERRHATSLASAASLIAPLAGSFLIMAAKLPFWQDRLEKEGSDQAPIPTAFARFG